LLAFSLGMAWLFLAPLSLWLLVRGSTGERAGALVTLALLEGGTIAMHAVLDSTTGDRSVVVHEVPSPHDDLGPLPRSAIDLTVRHRQPQRVVEPREDLERVSQPGDRQHPGHDALHPS
jgi:hypothetical protein